MTKHIRYDNGVKCECSTCDEFERDTGICRAHGLVNEQEAFIEFTAEGYQRVQPFGYCDRWKHHKVILGWEPCYWWIGVYWTPNDVFVCLIPTFYIRIRRNERATDTSRKAD